MESDAALERRFQPVLVEEPSVEDTISILRGLRDRCETHHQVQIRDSALVAAATLAHRYISDRQLPDKAIDAVDEAASRLRMELKSAPSELDELNRKVVQLEIEREGLRKESDAASLERLAALESELATLQEDQRSLQARWDRELAAVDGIADLKRRVDELQTELERATREMDLETAARIRYGELREAQQDLADAEAAIESGNRLVRQDVNEEDVADVVALWTGIPVNKLLEGDVRKLLHNWKSDNTSVWWASKTPSTPYPQPCAALARACRIRTARWARCYFLVLRGSARPNWHARWRGSCSTTNSR